MAEWRDIKGFEGLYQCSDEGEVRCVERINCRGYNMNGKILKVCLNRHNGYLRVGLHKNGKQYSYLVHRLIAETFLPNDDPTKEVNHINECKTDNRVSNLEWVSHTVNVNHGTAILRRAITTGTKVIQLSKDGNVLNEFYSTRDAQRNTGIPNQHICECINGKRKTAGGYLWMKKTYQQAS